MDEFYTIPTVDSVHAVDHIDRMTTFYNPLGEESSTQIQPHIVLMHDF